MTPFSTYIGNKIFDALFNNTAFTAIATPYVSLHTGDPRATGANEVAGGTYIRKLADFTAAASKAGDNTAAIEFPGMPAVTVTHIGIWDAEAAGNFIMGGTNPGTQVVALGNTFRLAAGALDATLT